MLLVMLAFAATSTLISVPWEGSNWVIGRVNDQSVVAVGNATVRATVSSGGRAEESLVNW